MTTSSRPWIRLSALLAASWVVMTFTHELGHLIGGWCSGGTLISADLWPWHLPHSLFAPDPHPLVTLWGGPLLGVAIPVLAAGRLRQPSGWLIASACVLANGLYLATAWLSGDRYLDTPRLLEQGASPRLIGLYCALTVGSGYWAFRNAVLQLFATGKPIGDSQSVPISKSYDTIS